MGVYMYLNLVTLACILLLTLTLAPVIDSQPGTVPTGRFKMSEGSSCTWFEVRKNRTKTLLGMACVCRDEEGKSQGYSCQYEGNLEECKDYQKDPRSFFKDVVKTIRDEYSNACEPDAITVCPDIALQRVDVNRLESPCVPDKTKKEEL